MEGTAGENGTRRWRPTVPVFTVVLSVVVALVAVSALLLILFQETIGPGEVLRDFSERLADGDCPGSYELLDEPVRGRVTEEEWCAEVPRLSGELPPSFEIDRVTLEGQDARVEVSGPGTTEGTWLLGRDGRSWVVKHAGAAIDFPGELVP
jgi:hypothetical protein